jgi:hypothetical protein
VAHLAARRRLLRQAQPHRRLLRLHAHLGASACTRLVTRLVALLVVDYSASRRLVVNYFAYAVRPGASARRVAHLTARRRLLRLAQSRRRLLRLAQARR